MLSFLSRQQKTLLYLATSSQQPSPRTTRMRKHSTRQQLKSEHGLPLISQPTYTFGASKTGYVLWSDIRSSCGGSSYLEKDGRRVFLEVDANYKV